MKPTIVKNEKNLKILNKLISRGFYKGFIENNKFELSRNCFPNNFKIQGILNDNGSCNIRFKYKTPLNYLSIFCLVLLALVSIFFLIKGNWLFLILFILFSLILVIDFKLKEKKEIHLFTDKVLEFKEKKH